MVKRFQGDVPLGLPPLWGREGVTLIIVLKFYNKMDSDKSSSDLKK
jgi:hypothetical protein